VKFDLSIAISSYNRDDKVAKTLTTLYQSDLSGVGAVEVIVIDDGSPKRHSSESQGALKASPRLWRRGAGDPALGRPELSPSGRESHVRPRHMGVV